MKTIHVATFALLFSTQLLADEEPAPSAAPLAEALPTIQRSRTIGGTAGSGYLIKRDDGALLTGFAFYVGNYGPTPAIQCIQPIFSTPAGVARGPMIGTPVGPEQVVAARDGYAVGGLNGKGDHVVNGFEIVFMRIKDGRQALDPTEAYASEWIGGGGGAEALVGGDGRPVIGIFGRAGTNLDSLGVIQPLPGFFDKKALVPTATGSSVQARASRAYEQSVHDIWDETNTKKMSARCTYLIALERVATNAVKAGDAEFATAVDGMRGNLRSHETIDAAPPSDAAVAWVELHRAFLAELAKADADSEARAERALSDYLAQLQAESTRLEKTGDATGAEAVRAMFRSRPPGAFMIGGVERTRMVGNLGGSPFIDLGDNGALLVGVEFRTTRLGSEIIGSVQPIYRTAKDTATLGDRYGETGREAVLIEANPGYAVGALILKSARRVDGFEIIFMRVKGRGAALDPADSYSSGWCGGTGGGEPRKLGGDGRPVLGICGRAGADLDAIGLIQKAAVAK